MAIQSMEDLMLQELQEIYSAERLAVRAYPKLRKAVQSEALQQALERHLEQTKEQVERLGKVFELMEARTRGKTCHAMQGLVEEAQEHAEADLAPELVDVMLLTDLQKIEHFEIAAYGSARAHAQALGMQEAVNLLDETLNEEKETDSLLNKLATDDVNMKALSRKEEDEEEEGEENGSKRSGSRSKSKSSRSK